MRTAKIIIFSLLLSIWANTYAQHDSLTNYFEQANALYAQNNYEEAISKYDIIIKAGYESSSLFYNIANAHYRLNNIAESVYYYEKAKLLDPGNKDIIYNSEMAELLVYNKPTPIPQIGIVKFYNNFIISKNQNLWPILSIIFLVLSLGSIAIFIAGKNSKTKKTGFIISIISFIFFIISFVFMQKQNSFINADDKAIIFEEKAPVKSSPDDNSTLLFEVFEGYKVTIADRSGIWYKIILEDGKQGWINKETLKII